MSEPSPDPCALIGIVKNPNGSITRESTRFPRVPATPVPCSAKPLRRNQRHHPTQTPRGCRRLQTLPRLLQPHGA
ncbi:unnamed protein product [Brassica oleracea]